jgi:hypothetical protein
VHCRPSSVSVRARLDRFSSRTPRCASSAAIVRLIVGCDVLFSRATAVKPPVSTTRANNRMPDNRSMAPHEYTQRIAAIRILGVWCRRCIDDTHGNVRGGIEVHQPARPVLPVAVPVMPASTESVHERKPA